VSRTASYRLTELRAALAPTTIYWFSRLGSTNTRAAAMARRDELSAPSIVLTGWQVAGRGRGTNTWWSSAGSLTATFAFRADLTRPAHHLPLLAGVIIRRTVAQVTGVTDVKLKWPNDLLHNGRKVCGMLCERVNGYDLIGVGLNVNLNVSAAPPLLRRRITSLSEITGRQTDQSQMLISLATAMRIGLSESPSLETVLSEYNQHHLLAGRQVSVSNSDHQQLSGFCIGLDPEGRLILKSGSKLHHIIAGNVEAIGAF